MTVGAVNDPLEREADRVADQVLRTPAGGAEVSAAPPQISRACAACDKDQELQKESSPQIRRKCVACEEEEIQRKAAGPQAASPDATNAVQETLRAPGRPLDAATRAYFEPRFGRNFGAVRVHEGGAAERSARALNAHAYTAGRDIVFGAGRFTPGTHEGRRLIAHELTHVLQQSHPAAGREGDSATIQRFVPCEQATLSGGRCPPRQDTEVAESRTDPMTVQDGDQFSDAGDLIKGYVIAGFEVGRSAIKPGLKDLPDWRKLSALMTGSDIQWKIHGLSDCSGSPDLNGRIRKARAQAIYNLLPAAARKNVVAAEAAPLTECITGNQSRVARTVNRSVLIEQVGRQVVVDPSEEEPIEGKTPDFVCGPDVTTQVADAVRKARSIFGGWNRGQREDACDALVNLRVGYCSWDIVELHNNKWIHQTFRPTCATEGAKPACGESVQIDDQCYYAGSANYVIYGTMFRLCADEDPDGVFEFTKPNMKTFIDLYKGSGVSGLSGGAPNFKPASAWAVAGYEGWPSGGTPPAGDRSNCEPLCPLNYTGADFDIHWYPHHKTEGCTPSIKDSLRS